MNRLTTVFLTCNLLFIGLAQGQYKARMVIDINQGPENSFNSRPEGFMPKVISFKDRLVLITNSDTNMYNEKLYTFNPKTNALTPIVNTNAANSKFFHFEDTHQNGNYIYLNTQDDSDFQIYVTDGITLNKIQEKNSGRTKISFDANIVASPNGAFFGGIDNRGTELWYTDGMSMKANMVVNLDTGMYGSNTRALFYHNKLNRIFFTANNNSNLSEPFSSDGTSVGTKKLFRRLPNRNGYWIGNYFEFGDMVLFTLSYDNGSGYYSNELYISDGLNYVDDPICTNTEYRAAASNNYALLGGKCIFNLQNSLYITDGSKAGTTLITKDYKFGCYSKFFPIGNKLIFTAIGPGQSGRDIYITDGTTSGTKLLKRMNMKSCYNTDEYTILNNKVYFVFTTNCDHQEIWETDGTATGTKFTFEINSGASRIINLITHQDRLYFIGTNASFGSELWEYAPVVTHTHEPNAISPVSVYPNPALDRVLIKSNEQLIHTELYNANGSMIESLGDDVRMINLANYPNGIYYIKYQNISGKINSTRFVKH